jgi:hypothetical protein
MATVERERVESFGKPEDSLTEASPWYLWGPYVAERAWGTVREDYSGTGAAWDSFPHDHARSRAYRWSEDGLAAVCDVHQRLCLGIALWNGRDPILKERIFGLGGPEGNHGEDAKEYWWYRDAIPSHAWLSWRYHYPQSEFPYTELVDENRRRGKLDPEYELLDTGVFDDDRYWIVEVDYAKAGPTDLLMRIRVRNAGPEADEIDVLPTLWFRNTWSWGDAVERPELRWSEHGVVAEHTDLGEYILAVAPGPDGQGPEPLFCENETNAARVFGFESTTEFPKDGINDHVVEGALTVNPGLVGTKAALRYRVRVEPGETVELRLRLSDVGAETSPGTMTVDFDSVFAERKAEADAFYDELIPATRTDDEKLVARQAFAGMIWSKQYYHYDVARWLDGDPGQPPPPLAHRTGRNNDWRHLEAADILSMPDCWEYPWFAAWDLAFHTVVLAHLDPAFAKYQLLVMCREWFQNPNGALPAYEWAFDDVNPPVHAWAAFRVWQIDGRRDRGFLVRIFHKLLLNFTWWVNREDPSGTNLFEGGFLGLDNIGPFDRSHMPVPGTLEQSDATAWMAAYCLTMLAIAFELSDQDPAYDDIGTKFLEHYVRIVEALNSQGLWDDEAGFYYDVLLCPNGDTVPIKVQSLVGMLPLLPTASVPRAATARAAAVRKGFSRLVAGTRVSDGTPPPGVVSMDSDSLLVGVCHEDRLRRILARALDEERFLSPYGLRSLSRWHLDHPYTLEVEGVTATIGYEPAESRSGLFGGNSNWRGPVWFPLNYLLVESLDRFYHHFGDSFTVELPTGSGNQATLAEVAAELRRRLVALFLRDDEGRRAALGAAERFQKDPEWSNAILFYEYFHGDTGAGLGASHQTGWTGLVADLIMRK